MTRDVGEKVRSAIWEAVRREFPDDEMMQEIHFVRRLHGLQTEGMSADELIAFYEGGRPETVSVGDHSGQ